MGHVERIVLRGYPTIFRYENEEIEVYVTPDREKFERGLVDSGEGGSRLLTEFEAEEAQTCDVIATNYPEDSELENLRKLLSKNGFSL